MKLDIVSGISESEFVENYIVRNRPVVVRNIPYTKNQWTPDALRRTVGHLSAQIYGSLFDLEDVMNAEEYIDDYFGQSESGLFQDDVPYIRWYSQLKDVEFAWGDDAFSAVSSFWDAPECLPKTGLMVPPSATDKPINPVNERFPYRGMLLAARGARTRLHRDPFFSDAVVCQFYGSKQAALYHPSRAPDLLATTDQTSFGGYADVREHNLHALSREPDLQGEINAGDMIYIPHGWLHDVIAVSDSISVTWNFVHHSGAREFMQYLQEKPETDSEFEVLQYFYSNAGFTDVSAPEIARIAREIGKAACATATAVV